MKRGATACEALRPFAMFCLDARPGDEFTISCEVDGDRVATLTGADFHRAFAVYATTDPLSLEGLRVTGLYTPPEGKKDTPRVWPWFLTFWLLGLLTGAM